VNLIHTTLIHKILPPKTPAAGKPPALIMLHGRGADENDLFGLSQYLDERLFNISVRAPFSFQFGGGYTWYDIIDIGTPEAKMFDESYKKLVQFLEDVKKGYPIDPAKIILFGFSMGAMMSFALTLAQPDSIYGVVANSGLLPEDTDLKFEWNKIKGKPFFVAHGKHDSIIPISLAHRAKELLTKAGADLTYREYEMDHQIDEESLNDIMSWLSKHI
jgi:phospholipase/carboxylesterase